MSIPALLQLRAALPDTHIAILTAEKLAGIWQNQEVVDEVLVFDRTHGVGQVSRQLRAGRFDAALILPNSFRSAFESWLAGIPVRVGYGRRFLLTHSVPPRREHIEMRKKTVGEIQSLIERLPAPARETFPAGAHHLNQYLKLTAVFGAKAAALAPLISVGEDQIASFLAKFSLKANRLRLGLNPGAEYGPAKRWPVENFTAVAQRLATRPHMEWLIFGGPGDVATAKQIEAALSQTQGSVANLAGRTNLPELMAGLSLCRAVLTNDTGPMHLAAAVGSRVVVPFGSTSPELTGPGLPGGKQHQLILGSAPCAPCFLRVCPIDFRCMRSISPDAVAERMAAVLDGKA